MFTDNSEDIVQNKLLLLYIIKTSPKKFNKDELSEFLLNKGYINYFQFQQYLSELTQGDFIKVVSKDNLSIYKILEKGEKTLELFENKIPVKIKEDLLVEFKLQDLELKRETQIKADIFKKENNQYNVNLKLVENEAVLFSLYLEVPSEDQAEYICNLWKQNPNEIFQKIISIFIDED